MRHTLRLNTEERIEAWLSLCELTFLLMKKTLSRKRLIERLKKIREEHLKSDYLFLANLGNLKNEKR